MRITGRLLGFILTISTMAVVQATSPVRPDFSGTWMIVPSRSIWLDEGNAVHVTVFGERFAAKQTDRMLTIAIENEKGFKWVYNLDGQVSLNSPPGPLGVQQTSSSVTWSDSELIIAISGLANHVGQEPSPHTRRILKLDADGTLRVEAPWGPNGAMISSVYARVR